jgi:hypothetical protein
MKAQEIVAAPGVPKVEEPQKSTAQPEPDEHQEAGKAKGSVSVKEALLEKSTIHIVDLKNSNKTDIAELRLRVFDTDIDPSDLVNHNRCNVELSGTLKVQDRKKGALVDIINAAFEGKGQARPFDPVTGMLAPEAKLSLKVPKDAQLGGLETLSQAAGKDDTLEKVKGYVGIDLGKVPLGGKLQQDLSAELLLTGNRLEWLADGQLQFPDYHFTMKKGSWLDSAEGQSRQTISCQPSETIAKELVAGITERYGAEMAANIQKVFDGGNGKLAFEVILTGPPDKPKPTITPETMKRLVEIMGGSLLQGLFSGQK